LLSDNHSPNQSIWARVGEQVSRRVEEAPSLEMWEIVAEHLNVAKYRPFRINDAEIADVTSKSGAKQYMLRNPHNNQYLMLGDEELFLWNLMDGKNTVKDLLLEYFNRYEEFGQQVVISLIGLLKSNGFLQEKPHSVMRSLAANIQKRKFLFKIIRLIGFFTNQKYTTRHGDKYFDWFYRRFAWVFYTRPGIIVGFLFVLASPVFFYYLFFVKHIGLLLSANLGRSPALVDVIIALLLVYGSIFLHEVAHGLSVKAYGRSVLRNGIVMTFGMPMPFVDTTDIWMKGRRARMVVSFSGPWLNGILSSLLCIVGILLPEGDVRSVVLLAGMLNTVLFIFNLVPIFESDGHYLIQDYLEFPRLRGESISFVTRGMWQKLLHLNKWSRKDVLLLCYGTLAVFGIVLMTFLAINMWFSTLRGLLNKIVAEPVLAFEILGFLVLVAIIVAGIRNGFHFVKKRARIRLPSLQKVQKERYKKKYR